MKIELLHSRTNAVIFSGEYANKREAILDAIKQKTSLYSADLSSANLSSADLSSADLSSANLRSANLYSANLSSANLRSANLSSADLSSANLYSANLYSANLYSANLSSADLSSANLRSANLRSANLYSADLPSANLYSADLSSANLYSANLSSADLRFAKGINKYLITPLLMLKDQVGKIRAYKLVNKLGEGPYMGGIVYKINESYEVSDANTNENQDCGTGINVATLDWCIKRCLNDYCILIVEFTAEDIAAIPTATDGKFRVFRCKVVGEKNLQELGLAQEDT